MLLHDARIYQIVFLALFLILGIGTRDWTLHPGMIGVAIATCLLTQGVGLGVGMWVDKRRQEAGGRSQEAAGQGLAVGHDRAIATMLWGALPSALITGLGLSLLLRTDHYSTMMLAAIAAILSKFLLRIRGKHLFNPANIGIVAAVLLTQDAWISPGQWGAESWYALLFIGTGGIVLQRVGRWDTTLTFLGTYALLEGVRNLWLGWTWDVWGHRLMSGSLLLFALFMMTDPRTIPNARAGRLIWAIAIALLTFLLRNLFFVPTAVVWALFVLSPLTLLLDWLFQADPFSWKTPQPVGHLPPFPSPSTPIST